MNNTVVNGDLQASQKALAHLQRSASQKADVAQRVAEDFSGLAGA